MAEREFPGAVLIARCPEHGLHGQRGECFECGGPVDQVEMVEVARLPYVLAFRTRQEVSILRVAMRRYLRAAAAATATPAASLLDRLDELGG